MRARVSPKFSVRQVAVACSPECPVGTTAVQSVTEIGIEALFMKASGRGVVVIDKALESLRKGAMI